MKLMLASVNGTVVENMPINCMNMSMTHCHVNMTLPTTCKNEHQTLHLFTYFGRKLYRF